MKKLLSKCITGILLCLTATNAFAERLQWKVEDGGNGHYYESFDARVTWSQANKLAKALGGHLVTITSDAENRWVFDNLGKPFYFLGGTDALEEGNWRWVTNEKWEYDSWNRGQPSNDNGNDDFLTYYKKPYLWYSIKDKARGFIIEYQNAGSSTPATLSHDFKLHIPLLHYSPLANDKTIMSLSIDMEIKFSNELLFKVVDFKDIK